MRPLALDYQDKRGSRPAAFVVMAAAIAITADVGIRYRALTQEIEGKQARLAKAAVHKPERKPAASAVSSEEYAFARQTAWRLSVPWDRLFRALEAAATEGVALLAIEPDIDNRTVHVSGEARDYLAALSYVASLSEQKGALAKVHLQRHEVRTAGSERPIAFTLSATWPEQP